MTQHPTTLTIFARFHAAPGREADAADALSAVAARTRMEPGCLRIETYRSIRDARLFHLHSQWIDEAAFDRHAELDHTTSFIRAMEALVDQPMEVSRTGPLAAVAQP
jgi:quinol monooxygenase YgiN